MAKIVARSKVYWNDGTGREIQGTVEQIMHDHVMVNTPTGKYLVTKSSLKTKSVKVN